MAKTTNKSPNWGKLGGSHSMQGKHGVGTQKPGVSSQEGSKGAMSKSIEPQAGPSGAGFYSSATTNKDYAGQQTPGVSGATKSGGNAKFAEGGKHAMFGNRGSLPARAGRTGQ
jgi:hypothetical protein